MCIYIYKYIYKEKQVISRKKTNPLNDGDSSLLTQVQKEILSESYANHKIWNSTQFPQGYFSSYYNFNDSIILKIGLNKNHILHPQAECSWFRY